MGGVIIVMVCVVGSIVWGLSVGKNRREEMAEPAAKLGLKCSGERNYQVADRYAFLDQLEQGSNRYAYNMIHGNYQGYEVAVFDYHYETPSPDSKGQRQTLDHHFSFFILTLEKGFPELTIAKEGLFFRIDPAGEDINFESVAFSNLFSVRSKNKKFARDFCTEPMIDHLISQPNIHIAVSQNFLVTALDSSLKVEDIELQLNQLLKIRSLMPDSLFS